MGCDGEWKKAAMTDDTVVAELLLRLNEVPNTTTPPPSSKPALSLEWRVRQRRSKAVTVGKKPGPRASPSTPLSWSGATSHSGGGGGSGTCADGGSEESSKPQQPVHPPKRSDTTRSVKVTNEATTSRRARRKKTLAELKQEEILLLKERRQLKRDLASVRVNLEKQRLTNENLKRMKLDLHSQRQNEEGTTVSILEAISGEIQNTDSSKSSVPASSPAHDASSLSRPPKICSEGPKEVTRFILPDLNLPSEEDCNIEVVFGAS